MSRTVRAKQALLDLQMSLSPNPVSTPLAMLTNSNVATESETESESTADVDTSSSDSSDDEGGNARNVVPTESSRLVSKPSKSPSTRHSKYGLQKPSSSHTTATSGASTGSGDASLGPTSYIIGKRKRYMEEKDQSNRNSNFSRHTYASKRNVNDEVNTFLRDIEKSGLQ